MSRLTAQHTHPHRSVLELLAEPQHLSRHLELRQSACSSTAQLGRVLLLSLLVAMLVIGTHRVEGADIFTSLAELPKVLHAEYSLAEELRNYVHAEQRRLDRLKELADEFEVHSSKALADPESYLGNPVGAFLLIKRFASDWKQVIERDIRSNTTEEFLYNISSKTNLFPDQADLDGAATALLRIQDTYALSTAKLATGDLQGVQDSPRMTAEDCYKLGWVAYNKQDYYHTVLWMDEALKSWDAESEKTIDRATLLDYLSYSVYVQGNVRRALNLTIEWINLVTTDAGKLNQQFLNRDRTSWKFHRGIEPSHIRAQNNKMYFEKTLREQEELHGPQAEHQPLKNQRPLRDYQSSTFFMNYERLCRGENVVDQPLVHKLKCYYRRHHPFFYIRPALEEVVSLKPRMYFYRNILSEEEINTIKSMANTRLYRSVVYHKNGDEDTTVQDYRISKSAWLKDVESPILKSVSNKASYLANLTLHTAEDLQVLNYGIGGHYEPHYDFATGRDMSTFEKAIGNRIATVICYLSDVTGGGATVFPDIGVKIFPEKGSCVMWYNLLRSGAGDMRTRHAACPVLTGIKWVVNKWFHERGQEFERQCGLTPDVDN